MAFSNGGGRKRGIMAEINVTPLTDVFLVLLIIFMITSSVMMKPRERRSAGHGGGRAGDQGRHGHHDARRTRSW